VPFTKADFDGYTVDLQLVYSRDWYMIAEQDGKTIGCGYFMTSEKVPGNGRVAAAGGAQGRRGVRCLGPATPRVCAGRLRLSSQASRLGVERSLTKPTRRCRA
jgi:hypothetical protein